MQQFCTGYIERERLEHQAHNPVRLAASLAMPLHYCPAQSYSSPQEIVRYSGDLVVMPRKLRSDS